jgi:hypothetical protein
VFFAFLHGNKFAKKAKRFSIAVQSGNRDFAMQLIAG